MHRVRDKWESFACEPKLSTESTRKCFRGEWREEVPFYAVEEMVCCDLNVDLRQE